MESLPREQHESVVVQVALGQLTLDQMPIEYWRLTDEEMEAIGERFPRFGEEVMGPEF